MDARSVASAIRARMADLRGCYEQALGTNRQLRGRIDVQFTIGDDGRITTIATHGMTEAPAFSSCVVRVIVPIQFARPEGGPVDFSFPFNFSPEQ